MEIQIKSLYICVTNMDRAIQFYESFFEIPVTVSDSIYSVFDINGFRFGLFAFEKMRESHEYGSNCLPSLSVSSKEILEQKVEGLSLCFPLTKIGANWVVEFIDSEGNHIELTSPIK